VRLSTPMIEAPLLLSDVGAAVTLLNWSGSDVQSLKMTVRLPFVVKSVESVQKGKLAFQQMGLRSRCRWEPLTLSSCISDSV